MTVFTAAFVACDAENGLQDGGPSSLPTTMNVGFLADHRGAAALDPVNALPVKRIVVQSVSDPLITSE